MRSDSTIKPNARDPNVTGPNVTEKVPARTAPGGIAAFRRSAEIGANRIMVDAGGEIVLTGALRCWTERRAPD